MGIRISKMEFCIKRWLKIRPLNEFKNYQNDVEITLAVGLSIIMKTTNIPACLAVLTADLTVDTPSLVTPRPSDTITNN